MTDRDKRQMRNRDVAALILVVVTLVGVAGLMLASLPVSVGNVRSAQVPEPTETPTPSDPTPTDEPYPGPTSATPGGSLATKTPDPTYAAMTAQAIAELTVSRIEEEMLTNPRTGQLIQGPLAVVQSANVWPGDFTSVGILPEDVARVSYPDVAMILSGHFRHAGDSAVYGYRLYVADRTQGIYFSKSSNDLAELQTLMPLPRTPTP